MSNNVFENISNKAREIKKKVFPNSDDTIEKKYLKSIILTAFGVIFLMIVIALIVFFLSIKGSEITKVPDVLTNENKKVDIITAITRLQEKGLSVNIQLKHSSKYTRGIVIDQRPKPGSVVKLGRKVLLTISQGNLISEIENYIGKNIDWLRVDLAQTFATDRQALLEINEPVKYEYDSAAAGTIIEQSPPAGTSLIEGKITYLDLVVSKGPKGKSLVIDPLIGVPFDKALMTLASYQLPFSFAEETKSNEYKENMITFQNPKAGTEVTSDTNIELRFNPPKKIAEGKEYGIFEYITKKYEVPVDIELVVSDNAKQASLIKMKHSGGKISVPYVVAVDSELILYISGTKVDSKFVHKKTN